MNVTAHQNISTSKRRKIVQELKRNKKKNVIENPMPVGEDGLTVKTNSLEESFEKLWIKIGDHYGFDLREL